MKKEQLSTIAYICLIGLMFYYFFSQRKQEKEIQKTIDARLENEELTKEYLLSLIAKLHEAKEETPIKKTVAKKTAIKTKTASK